MDDVDQQATEVLVCANRILAGGSRRLWGEFGEPRFVKVWWVQAKEGDSEHWTVIFANTEAFAYLLETDLVVQRSRGHPLEYYVMQIPLQGRSMLELLHALAAETGVYGDVLRAEDQYQVAGRIWSVYFLAMAPDRPWRMGDEAPYFGDEHHEQLVKAIQASAGTHRPGFSR